ncbi:BMP family ABC transporter substrate-binding protein [Actinophytocola xinjiangensis]|uniref:BMP family ABC transporter substrate-binding protein n=1 Tax=Actinophytocola xinjiangensis TaxID=485602 RepID=A0A7Z0WD32_9PSEU|nr:BMP family ABC transporter substrate-binding protein [Actinophytocola xinjiangensis]OLF04610.1 BMP family ABC transporter substrate-binding protein [Actinophytocola xinjiangensis]
MRFKRGVAVTAIALTSVLSVVGCAKDSASSDNGSGNQNGAAAGCQTVDKPAAAEGKTSTTETAADVDGSKLKVGLAFDIGGRGDASFNDSAAAGLDEAIAQLGVKKENTKELTASDQESEDAKQTRLRQLATEGHNPIVSVGFAYSEAVVAVAKQFPNIKFAVVDGFAEGAPENVTFLGFAEHEGSFLVGVIAALKSESCNIGFVGGVNVPLIQKFQAGFEQGVKAVAPDATIESRYITEAGDLTGFTDAPKGQVTAKGLIDGGADVIYHAAGASGKGVFAAAHEAGVMAIGVDSDQYNQETVAEFKDVIISSMLKRVDVAVYDYISAVAANDLASLPPVFDLKVDGVGYSTTGGKIDAETQEWVESYKQQIIDGKVTVEDSPTGS